MINNLFESIMKGSGNKNLDILFKELHEYVSSHFAAEESLMKLFFPSHEAYAHHGQNSEIRKTLQGRGAGNGHRNVELFV
jgi:hemerythrin